MRVGPGSRLRHYVIEGLIAQSGMGSVWRALDTRQNQRVAIKAVATDLIADPEFRIRIRDEARRHQRLQHPNIVPVIDVFAEGGIFCIVTKLIEGSSLATILAQRHRLEIEEAIGIVKSVLTALDYVHRHGIVHRDVKPSNVLVDHHGWVWLFDFGIAIAMGGQHRTRTGVTVGALSYMSPEQITHSRAIDHRSDVYSVGCLLYELLTGRPPFVKNQDGVGDTDFALEQAHVTQQPVRPSHRRSSIPRDLDEIVMRALAKAADDRLPGCQEFVRLLDQVGEPMDLCSAAPASVSPHGAVGRPSVVRQVIDATARAAKSVIDLIRPKRVGEVVTPYPAEPVTAASTMAEPVLLAVGAPRRATLGSSFTARFAAYVAAAKASAQQHLEALGEKDDRVVTDIPPDRHARWRVGAPITVRLTGEHITITPEERTFEWNGHENLASFAVRIDADAPPVTLALCFHVFLGPLQIAFIPLGVAISASITTESKSSQTEAHAPSSAFASYSSKDAEAVTRSLSTLAHWVPTLDIFQDCLDLTPNEAYKPRLAAEIAARDVFLLFWSRNARASQWVRWEFETARVRPGMNAILPMPLEDPSLAPPPKGFEDKHLRDRFMIAGYGLKKIAEIKGGTPV